MIVFPQPPLAAITQLGFIDDIVFTRPFIFAFPMS